MRAVRSAKVDHHGMPIVARTAVGQSANPMDPNGLAVGSKKSAGIRRRPSYDLAHMVVHSGERTPPSPQGITFVAGNPTFCITDIPAAASILENRLKSSPGGVDVRASSLSEPHRWLLNQDVPSGPWGGDARRISTYVIETTNVLKMEEAARVSAEKTLAILDSLIQ